MMGRLKIFIGSAGLAKYPEGGGHWSWHLQYLLGLRALGHDVFLLELLPQSGRLDVDRRRIAIFFARLRRIGFNGCCALVLQNSDGSVEINESTVFGTSATALQEKIKDTDVVWNLCCALRSELLNKFRRKALLDLDPGHLQVSARTVDLGIEDHDVFFTVGTKINDSNCEIPRLGLVWHWHLPPIYLRAWKVRPQTDISPLTSVTQWNWGEVWLNGRILSIAKRDAYLKYLDVPLRCRVPFLLAANMHPRDATGDRELLVEHKWELVHPHHVARTPAQYMRFIQSSLAEFCCAKPIFVALKTGWVSDRSAAYLASGRPVLAEDTGFSEHVEAGLGLLAFSDLESAINAIDDLITNREIHCKAAREIAEAYFTTEKVLPNMIEACS
jgi:hypothetical protein